MQSLILSFVVPMGICLIILLLAALPSLFRKK
jgi:hypothetical protein